MSRKRHLSRMNICICICIYIHAYLSPLCLSVHYPPIYLSSDVHLSSWADPASIDQPWNERRFPSLGLGKARKPGIKQEFGVKEGKREQKGRETDHLPGSAKWEQWDPAVTWARGVSRCQSVRRVKEKGHVLGNQTAPRSSCELSPEATWNRAFRQALARSMYVDCDDVFNNTLYKQMAFTSVIFL